MILILSNKWDLTVDFVVSELRSRGGDFLRINTEDLASGQATIHLPDFQILVSKHKKICDLTHTVNVVWNRRPGRPFDNASPSAKPSLAIQRFVNDQWFSWLETLQLLSGVTWINHPQANDAMECKPRQLLLASQIGFQVPDTVISNDPGEVRLLARKHRDRLVAKALYSPLIEEPDEDFFVFTNEINITDLSSEEDIRISPSIFQQSLRPKVDYRVTVVGETVLPVEVQDQGGEEYSHIDWRTKKTGLNFSACNLPPGIEEKCKNYVRVSGLIFGAIDLVRHDDKFFFLEINPNGEWGWLQHPHGIPIAKALCDLMLTYDKSGKH
jgi:hypothetical protein